MYPGSSGKKAWPRPITSGKWYRLGAGVRNSCKEHIIHMHTRRSRLHLLEIFRIGSGGASALKEPGHFWGQKILQPGHLHFFPQNSWRSFSSCRPRNTGRQRRFTVKIKQIKRSDMVTFLVSVHTITEAKQYAGLGRAWARAVDLPARLFDLARPGIAPPLRIGNVSWNAACQNKTNH